MVQKKTTYLLVEDGSSPRVDYGTKEMSKEPRPNDEITLQPNTGAGETKERRFKVVSINGTTIYVKKK